MATTPIPPAPQATAADRATGKWRDYLPAIAAVTYLVAWVAGLAAWPVNLALNASAAQVTAAFRQHPAEAVVQLVLVEGLAGLLLGVVLAATIIRRPTRSDRRGRPLVPIACAAIAVAASVLQCVIGLVLTAAATSHDITRSGDLEALVNRLDGVKMLAIAAVAAWLATAVIAPRWLRVSSVLLAVAIAVSGCAYLALANALGWAAYIAGVLLLVWVTGLGIWLTVSRRRAGQSGRRGVPGARRPA